MSTRARQYRARQTLERLRAIRRRLTSLRQQVRRGATLALTAAAITIAPASTSHAQTGQTAMAPAGGVIGRAVTGFRTLNEDGAGILYYGVNAADRGLGYRGSYMTLGGFIPGFQDDLGGFWAADLRGHLSEYGGFFSNVGAVRKQFLGGTLLGVGVYWDYDGDLNQYPETVIPTVDSPILFPGGQVYNQVGISGEWLTDYGNLRSNGYIPVGSTGQIAGPFLGNSLLCVNGINAALGGADLEVGAYIPGLADWAGMISVGGYALGNTRYVFPSGQAAVPWFGGVYTRLDMTFVENWDFSLQANNDSYFDWTGFARLTYRMGGSRRRNVPDQVEQPMMRNEHIVRAHQAPVEATNPDNLDADGNPLPWRVFHVDNSVAPGGNGTAETPFRTLAGAEAAADAAFDIVYVHVGNSLTTPYLTPLAGYSFGNVNQYLVGAGTTVAIPTVLCGKKSLLATDSPNLYPIISNPGGPAINVDQSGTTVAHLQIASSSVAITDGAGFSAPGQAFISDVIIAGDNGPLQRGVEIANSTGQFNFDNVRLSKLGNDGFVVSAIDGRVSIANSSLTDITGTGVLASGSGAHVGITNTSFTRSIGRAIAATGTAAQITLADSTITDTVGAPGSAVVATGTDTRINLTGVTITNTASSAIVASGAGSTVTASEVDIARTGNPAILVTGEKATVRLDASAVVDVTGSGVVVSAPDATFTLAGRSRLERVTANGIEVRDPDASVFVIEDSLLRNIGGDGIQAGIDDVYDGGSVLLQNSIIRDVRGVGIRASGVAGTTASGTQRLVAVQGGRIQNAVTGGILVSNSDLRAERSDPLDPLQNRRTTITNTGPFGIRATANRAFDGAGNPILFRVLVDEAAISAVTTGISVQAGPDPLNPPIQPLPTRDVPTIDFTGIDNLITTNGGPGIVVSAIFDADPGFPGQPLSRVNADISGNQITNPGFDIVFNTGGDSTLWIFPGGAIVPTPAIQRPITIAAGSVADLTAINNGATVEINPVVASVNFNPNLITAQPPDAPTPPLAPVPPVPPTPPPSH